MLLPLLFFVLMQTNSESPDSMLARLETAEGAERVELLLKLTRHYSSRSPQEALGFGEEVVELAGLLKDDLSRAEAYEEVSRVYMNLGAYSSALEYAFRGKDLAEKLENKTLYALALNNLGAINIGKGKLGDALKWLLLARQIREDIGDDTGLADSLNNIGNVYHKLSEPEKALEYFDEALSLKKIARDDEGVANVLNSIGLVYRTLGKNDEALKYYKDSLALFRRLDNGLGVASALSSIGSIYHLSGLFEESEAVLEEALEVSNRQGNRKRMAVCYSNLGHLFKARGQLDKSLDFHMKALALRRELGNRRDLQTSLRNVASVFQSQENYRMEARYLTLALGESYGIAEEFANLEMDVALAESERQVALLKKDLAVNRVELEERRLINKDLQIKSLEVNRQEQFRNNMVLIFSAILLLLAYLLNRNASRRQLETERRGKNELESLVAQRTEELVGRCHELETLEGIIQTINREVELPRVLQTMLEQGQVLFPQADRAAFLLWDSNEKHFEVAASIGYEPRQLDHVHFSHTEMMARYSSGDTLLPGVVLIENFENLPGSERTRGLPVPCSLVAIAVTFQGETKGFFVLESYTQESAFRHADMHKLIRFREHAVSAIEKAHNIEELRRINVEILKAQNKLVMQQKMASLGILSAGIAHEMKNPLNFVNTLTELIHDLGSELRETLAVFRSMPSEANYDAVLGVLDDLEENGDLINKHGKRANQIVQVMMEMAQGGSVEKRMFSLNSLADEFSLLACKGMQSKDVKTRVRLEHEFGEDVGMIEMAPQNLSRVIINLVNNAFESVLIRANREGPSFVPTIKLTTTKEDQQVVLRIRDNGCGISPHHKEQIWEHFFSTKPSGQGNIGLGLAISYDIVVNEHSGSIAVDSEEGVYAEFCITLPIRQPVRKQNSSSKATV